MYQKKGWIKLKRLIVGTSFHNQAFSLLRYVTGDIAQPENPEVECTCGRPGRLVKLIDGRNNDYITLPSGQQVATLASFFHHTEGLVEVQFFQDKSGDLTIRYVPSTTWTPNNIKSIERKLRNRIGNSIKIFFKQVDFVERTPKGKIKLVISEFNERKNSIQTK